MGLKIVMGLKKILPPSLWNVLRLYYNRARGVTMTPLPHEAIAALVQKPDPTILEIGCNDGTDTLKLLSMMPKAKIYCFEPDPRAIARFKKQLGPSLGKVKLFEVAVSDRTGRLDFHMSDGDCSDLLEGWDLSGSIRRPKKHLNVFPWVKFGKIATVDTCRLDDWCAENGVKHVDFIWMDVQGAEGDVISGGSKILQETRFLYTEIQQRGTIRGAAFFEKLACAAPII